MLVVQIAPIFPAGVLNTRPANSLLAATQSSYFNYRMPAVTQLNISSAYLFACNFLVNIKKLWVSVCKYSGVKLLSRGILNAHKFSRIVCSESGI
jgi:hypothetical protein